MKIMGKRLKVCQVGILWKKTRKNQHLIHIQITQGTESGERLVSLGTRVFFFRSICLPRKSISKQNYISARYFARFTKNLVFHINARTAYDKNVQEHCAKEDIRA
jgi:hypothetical protein